MILIDVIKKQQLINSFKKNFILPSGQKKSKKYEKNGLGIKGNGVEYFFQIRGRPMKNKPPLVSEQCHTGTINSRKGKNSIEGGKYTDSFIGDRNVNERCHVNIKWAGTGIGVGEDEKKRKQNKTKKV